MTPTVTADHAAHVYADKRVDLLQSRSPITITDETRRHVWLRAYTAALAANTARAARQEQG